MNLPPVHSVYFVVEILEASLACHGDKFAKTPGIVSHAT